MIQRIQTLFLLLASAAMVCFTLVNLGQVQTVDNTWFISAMALCNQAGTECINTWHTLIISILTALLPFVAIFLFKNLQLQKKLCYVTMLFCIALYAIAAYEGYWMMPGVQETSWSGTIVGPLLCICLCGLAVKYINKDIKLLRSYDRLR